MKISEDQQTLLRMLPGVDQLLEQTHKDRFFEDIPKTVVVSAIRQILDSLRKRILGILDEAIGRAAQEVFAYARRRKGMVVTVDVLLLLESVTRRSESMRRVVELRLEEERAHIALIEVLGPDPVIERTKVDDEREGGDP